MMDLTRRLTTVLLIRTSVNTISKVQFIVPDYGIVDFIPQSGTKNLTTRLWLPCAPLSLVGWFDGR
jgi:hypothetical protein